MQANATIRGSNPPSARDSALRGFAFAGALGPGTVRQAVDFFFARFAPAAALSGAFVFAPASGTWIYAHLGPDVLWFGVGALGIPLALWAIGMRRLAVTRTSDSLRHNHSRHRRSINGRHAHKVQPRR